MSTQNDKLSVKVVGPMVMVLSIGFVILLMWRLLGVFPVQTSGKTIVESTQVYEALIMLFAGGIGSCVYAIRAYILHACERQDFKRSFIPWYGFWPVQGSLLALIFYFVIRGGLILVTLNGESQAPTTLNVWSLAGIGAIVGLFSKYAIEKLHQVFITIFTSKADQDSEDLDNQITLVKKNMELIELKTKQLTEETNFLQAKKANQEAQPN